MHFTCSDNPIENDVVVCTFSWCDDKSWMEKGRKLEFLPPGTPGNPTRATPAYIKILDEFPVTIYESKDMFVKFDFDGKHLKGHWVAVRTEPSQNIWELRKEEKAPPVKESLSELLSKELKRLGIR